MPWIKMNLPKTISLDSASIHVPQLGIILEADPFVTGMLCRFETHPRRPVSLAGANALRSARGKRFILTHDRNLADLHPFPAGTICVCQPECSVQRRPKSNPLLQITRLRTSTGHVRLPNSAVIGRYG
jgi:hypothetical protein